jgi:hypothetical protein
MIDIISADANGLGTYDTQTPRAANILSVQLGSLEYAEELGIDLEFFLSEQFKFENEAFKSYLIEVLANRGINVSSVTELLESLFNQLTINIQPDEQSGGLLAR